jgi:hypothetical protein
VKTQRSGASSPTRASFFPDQSRDPRAHLGSGLVSKGQRKDFPWGDAAIVDEMGDTMSNRPGFAGTGAGENE